MKSLLTRTKNYLADIVRLGDRRWGTKNINNLSGVTAVIAASEGGISNDAEPSGDELVKISATDTTSDYLDGKITEGQMISTTVQNGGGDESLLISVNHPSQDQGSIPVAQSTTVWDVIAIGIDGDILQVGSGGFPEWQDRNALGIDHNQLIHTHNLTTDIDHASITNTHNLTTDIDHNSITNTHNLTTDIDHGSISGLADDDHTQYVKLAGRAGGQTANGGTASGEALSLFGSAHATKGAVNINGNFNVNQAGAHQNSYNGVAIALTAGIIPDVVSVTFGTALPDTNYSLQLTGYEYFYTLPMPKMIADPTYGMVVVADIFVITTWHIITKTASGFTAVPMYSVVDGRTALSIQLGPFVVAPSAGLDREGLEAFWGFTMNAANYTVDWAVRRY